MDSDLVHSSTIELDFHEWNRSKLGMLHCFEQSAFSFWIQTIAFIELHLRPRKFCIIGLLYRLINHEVLRELSSHQSLIILTNPSFSNHLIDILQCFIGFCRDQNARSIFIQSISKRRFKSLTFFRLDSGFLAVSLQIIVHTEVVSVFIAWMQDNSCRLVENKPLLIFIQNPRFYEFRIQFLKLFFLLRKGEFWVFFSKAVIRKFQQITFQKSSFLFGFFAIDSHISLTNPRINIRKSDLRIGLAKLPQKAVASLVGLISRDGNLHVWYESKLFVTILKALITSRKKYIDLLEKINIFTSNKNFKKMETIEDLINQINYWNTKRKELLEKKGKDNLFVNTELRRIHLEIYSLSKRLSILADKKTDFWIRKPVSFLSSSDFSHFPSGPSWCWGDNHFRASRWSPNISIAIRVGS